MSFPSSVVFVFILFCLYDCVSSSVREKKEYVDTEVGGGGMTRTHPRRAAATKSGLGNDDDPICTIEVIYYNS